jgi:hypothetical protein
MQIELMKDNVSGGDHTLHENPCKPWQKSHLNSLKNHICRWYDNLVKYLVQTRLYLWDIKITNFLFLYLTNKVEFGQDILQDCVSSYHLHMCFLVNLDDFFAMVCMGFHEGCSFHLIRCLDEMTFMLWDIMESCEDKHIWQMTNETWVDENGLVFISGMRCKNQKWIDSRLALIKYWRMSQECISEEM